MKYDDLPKDMTTEEAALVKKRFATTCGWNNLGSKHKNAIKALPDIEALGKCCTIIQAMACDALSDLRGEKRKNFS